MPSKAEIAAEMGERGLLPPDKAALHNEMKKRGLITLKSDVRGDIVKEGPEGLAYKQSYKQQYGESPAFGEGPHEFEARMHGVGPEGLGTGTAFKSSFGDIKHTAEQVLKERYPDKKIKVYKHPKLKEWVYTVGNNKPHRVNTADFGLEDVAEVAGHAIPLLAETAGVVGGTAIGSLLGPKGAAVGAVTGGIGAAYAGESARLRIGREIGANDYTDDQIHDMATQVSLFALGGGAVGAVGTGTAGAVGRRGGRGMLLDEIPAEELGAGIENAELIAQQTKAMTGEDLPYTAGQALRTSAPEVSSYVEEAERRLASRPVGRPLREDIYHKQRDVTRKLEDAIMAPYAGGDIRAPATIGREIQETALHEPQAELDKLHLSTAEAEEIAFDAARRVGGSGKTRAGMELRGVYETQIDDMATRFDGKYEALGVDADGTVIDVAAVRATGNKWVDILDESILKTLSPFDRKLAADAADAGLIARPPREPADTVMEAIRRRKGFEPAGPKRPPKEYGPVRFAVVQRALQDVRAELRRIGTSRSALRQDKALIDYKDALLESRDAALVGKPQLAKQVQEIEEQYALAKEHIDRGFIGKIMEKHSTGGYTMLDESIIDKILASPTGAKEIRAVVENPEYIEFTGNSLEVIRDGIRSAYRKAAINEETGLTKLGPHRTFMANKKEAMGHFFTEAEMDVFNNPFRAKKRLDVLEKKNAVIEKRINASFGFQVNAKNPEEVLNYVWNDPARIREVADLYRGSPDKWKEFQRAYVLKFKKENVTHYDFLVREEIDQNGALVRRAGDFGWDPKKLTLSLDGASGRELESVMGKQFIDDLRHYNRVLGLTGDRRVVGGVIAELANPAAASTVVTNIARAIGFPPLSRRGRAFSAALRANKVVVMKTATKMLSNPKDLHTMILAMSPKTTLKRSVVLLSSLGFVEMAIQMREFDEEERERTRQQNETRR